MGFEIVDEYPIELNAVGADGKQWKVVHVFRAPTEKEMLEYERNLPDWELKRNKTVKRGSRTKASLKLWDDLVVRVEGYTFKGKDIMEQGNWKQLLDKVLSHKVEAIQGFAVVWREEPEEPETDPLDGQSGEPSNEPGEGTAAQE